MFRLARFVIALAVLTHFFFLPTLLASYILPKRKRARWWRKEANHIIRTALRFAGIRLRTDTARLHPERQAIFASNHSNVMDGFALVQSFPVDTVLFVAPFGQFFKILAMWLSHMGAIDVARDTIDEARYSGTNSKREALLKAAAALKRGESVLIFPEGHTEKIDGLYYLHTGAARLSLATGIPIQPTIIKSSDAVFSNSFHRGRKTLGVSFGRELRPEAAYGMDFLFTEDERLRQKARDLTDELRKEFLRLMPLREKRETRPTGEKGIAAFVDIDMTTYHGLSQVDLVLDLMKKKKIPYSDGLYVFALFFTEKLGFISHESMMRKTMRLLRGWNEESFRRLVRDFFYRVAVPKIEYGLYPLIEDHLRKGHKLVFVSEAMQPLAEEFARFFGADEAFDTYLKRSGKSYTGEVRALCRGTTKAEAVLAYARENGINLRESYAYADSYSDLAVLELVGNPIAVQPDRKLKRHALAKRMRVLPDVS